MKVRVLGCSGAIARDCPTTSFLVDQDILIDAGTGVCNLPLDEMLDIQHVFLTHSHLDHVAALPLMVDATARCRSNTPIHVHALPQTLQALRQHLFNNVIWPDFTTLPSREAPLVQLHEVAVGQRIDIGGRALEVLPAVHSVPAVGYAVCQSHGGSGRHWVFSGDTDANPLLWQRLNQIDVAALVIETAFGDDDQELARRSGHLSPRVLAEQLDLIDQARHYPIYISHTKPFETATIMRQVAQRDQISPQPRHTAHDLRWLSAGHVFEL